jgi:DNA-directed RNA polymerase subunit H (RpoH/RPB5)
MDIASIINNIKEMLVERGDDISLFEEHELSVDKEEYENDRNIIEFQTSKTTVIFALTKKLRKYVMDELKNYEGDINNFITKYGNKKNVILIFNNDTVSQPVITQLNKYDKLFQKNDGQLQYFHAQQIMFNPTKHEYVPKHIKLSEKEASEFMNEYMIKSKLYMPVILHNDPIAKWLGLKQGDIVKIVRYNENSGVSFYYRSCF